MIIIGFWQIMMKVCRIIVMYARVLELQDGKICATHFVEMLY
jgi:hypothetical protein